MSIATVIGAIYYGEHQRRERLWSEAYNKGMQAMERNDRARDEVIKGWAALEAEARAIKPKSPLNFAARAAKTPKERRLADLMVFVAKYRERKHGDVIAFPAWLSAAGRQRLLEIANRGMK